MNLLGHGLDLIECERIAEIVRRHGDRFMTRVLTEAERAHSARLAQPIPHIAGRFAAKEAVLKVLGTGWRGSIAWTDVEVINDANGRPTVRLHGACRQIARRLGIDEILLSITHTANYAAASAIGMGKSSGASE
ncbi:MAG: holo-ACP synthase [Phycisphaerae bacterium]